MNLSIYLAGYLGHSLKDTTHLGNHKVFRHAKSSHIHQTPEALLFQQLGIAKTLDDPLAALLQAAEQQVEPLNTTDKSVHSPVWLVQAVHMALQRDTFSLQEVLALTTDEYSTLTALFNSHFKTEGYRFFPSQHQYYWFLTTPRPIVASTHLAQAVLNQNVQLFQPTGSDAKTLRQLMNEAQMLLHEHPINGARAANQIAAVNSVWVSGGGGLPTVFNSPIDALIGDSALIKGLSASTTLVSYPGIKTALAASAKHTVLLANTMRDVAWDAIHYAVKRNKIKHISIYLPVGNGSLHLQLTPLDYLKFWRKAHSLDMHMQQVYGQH